MDETQKTYLGHMLQVNLEGLTQGEIELPDLKFQTL